MKHKDIVDHFGSAQAACSALGVSKSFVSRWRNQRIPDLHQASLSSITEGKLQPDDEAKEWIKRRFPAGIKSADSP